LAVYGKRQTKHNDSREALGCVAEDLLKACQRRLLERLVEEQISTGITSQTQLGKNEDDNAALLGLLQHCQDRLDVGLTVGHLERW
jgi:hypothetical protein